MYTYIYIYICIKRVSREASLRSIQVFARVAALEAELLAERLANLSL